MPTDLPSCLLVLGRVLIGGLFVYAGARHFQLMPILTAELAARRVPYPRAVLIAANVFEIGAGALLALGVLVVPAALSLALFTVVASALLLDFWRMEGPLRVVTRNNLQSNIAVVGGLLVTAAYAM